MSAFDRVDKPFDADLEAADRSLRNPHCLRAGSGLGSRSMSPGSRIARRDGRSGSWIDCRFRTLSLATPTSKGDLAARFDTVVFASQNIASILHGYRAGELQLVEVTRLAKLRRPQRPEYTGGIGLAGAAALDEFVRGGGTLVAIDDATDLPVQLFGFPVGRWLRRGTICRRLRTSVPARSCD